MKSSKVLRVHIEQTAHNIGQGLGDFHLSTLFKPSTANYFNKEALD